MMFVQCAIRMRLFIRLVLKLKYFGYRWPECHYRIIAESRAQHNFRVKRSISIQTNSSWPISAGELLKKKSADWMNNRSNCTYICWSFVFSQTISIWLLVLLVGPRRLRHRHRDCRRFHIVGIFFFTVKCSSHRCRLHIDGFLSIPFVIFFFLLLFLDFHFALFTTIVGGCWLRLRHRGEHYRFCSHISFNIRHNNIVVLAAGCHSDIVYACCTCYTFILCDRSDSILSSLPLSLFSSFLFRFCSFASSDLLLASRRLSIDDEPTHNRMESI